jgi:23S rRNA pseudouridine1911/1915/1917 synthase
MRGLNLKAALYQPRVIEETDDFAVVYKPPKMHSAPLKKKEGGTLFEWYSCQSPRFFDLVHRLDFETHGLMLIAKSKKSFEHFKSLQESGGFVKEYSAICASSAVDAVAAGFPQPPVFSNYSPSNENPLIIESYFRPFGRGRKLVRPVTEIKKKRETAKDRGGFYRTEITGINENVFTVRIKRGFRHQIRCHLCWIGFPILNDPLYPHGIENGSTPACKELALRAHALFFTDPSTKEKREYRIDALDKTHV